MKKKSINWIFQTLILGVFLILFSSCKESENNLFAQETGSFSDQRDGKIYKTVKIGEQWIMAENFAYKPDQGNYWAFDNDTNNVAIYGYLYDWETAKKIAPEGWHLPSREEWITLRKTLGGKFEVWNYMEKIYPQLVVGGSSGFNALLGGIRSCDGRFISFNERTTFWSSTKTNNGISIYGLDSNEDSIPHGLNGSKASFAYRNDYQIGCNGHSIRLFKD